MDTIKQRAREIPRRTLHRLNSAKFLYHLHAYAALTWVVLLIPSWYLWRSSLFWVIFISLYANIATHWGAWQSARAELGASRAENAVERVGEHITVTRTKDENHAEVTITTDDATEITVETE